MKELIIPAKLNGGDKVAFISISGGRAGALTEIDCDHPGIEILESGTV